MSAARLALAPALLLLAAPFAPTRAETEIRWVSVSSGSGEVSPGEGFDLDFGNQSHSPADFQLERASDGIYWVPHRVRPGMGCGAAVASGDFDSLDLDKAQALAISLDRIYLCGGANPPLPNGTVLFVSTCEGNSAKVVIDDCGDMLKFRYASYRRQTVQKALPPGTLMPPPLLCPPDGVVFEHDPRVLLIAWGTVPAAATYDLEVDCKGCCGPRKEFYCSEQEKGKMYVTKTGLTSPAYDTIWLGAFQGRWRVRAVKADGTAGPWTTWSGFSFAK